MTSDPSDTDTPAASKRPGLPLPDLDSSTRAPIGLAEVVALGLGVIWTLGIVALYVLAPETALSTEWNAPLVRVLAVLMPVLMLLVAAIALRSARIMQEETQRLHAAISSLRHMYLAHSQAAAVVSEPSMAKKLEEIAETARKTETVLATFQTIRRTPERLAIPSKAMEAVTEQGSLQLGTPAEALAPPLSNEHFIRALNFPETAEDEEGFVSLRLALKDRHTAQVIRAAQDVLTLLSQEGIYMDDLRPDRARPDIWRQFAHGARGRAVAALGGIRDRSSLALSSARMKQDPIFRDSAHHFLRRFDQMFTRFEAEASDADISALSDTRTARAFMLLGRVAGTFD
ncbi:hypothetical protein [Tritonibacter horizontis]|uniref:Uncharacterized protein n=1 Tax=Tritonibacter horizontis TaxID=1768241 RepID=A0A132BXY1_9RHOB|nr:hypothetical protein [Tritonibacter horizontis]KUP93036.1 hypothetical protein TRIHO_20740 [Tritonibacter horizontis]